MYYTGYAVVERLEPEAFCQRCRRVYFDSKWDLDDHMDLSDAHNICADCCKDFSTATGLVQHYVQSPIHFYCQRCNALFGSGGALETHYLNTHHFCRTCRSIFDTAQGLHEHNRQKHFYCVSCKTVFQSASNLDSHMRSSVHQPKAYPCPGPGCGRSFVSAAARVLHWESDTCSSGVTRARLNRLVLDSDRGGVITNPARLIQGAPGTAVTGTWATEHAWNGAAYECFLCHRTFRTLPALNAHLRSPAHADRLYRCPAGWHGCGAEFGTLSALCQHVESGRCGVYRFKSEMDRVMGSLAGGMRSIAY